MLTLRADVNFFVVAVTVSNTGGVRGSYHLCRDSRPPWLTLQGDEDGRGVLAPEEKAELRIVVDVNAAKVAATEDACAVPRLEGSSDGRPSACAVLRLEADKGGAGVLLPVVCNFVER